MRGHRRIVFRQPSNREAAITLAEAGLAIFPCGQDRKPLVKWRDASTTDRKIVADWWDQRPEALPAVDCGKSGLVVIDADKHGGPDGVTAFHELERAHGLPTDRLVVETPRDGEHHYFRNDSCLGNSPGSLPPGIDVRGEGGFVFAPGATLTDGRGWRARGGLPAFASAFRTNRNSCLPDWLANLIGTPRRREDGPSASRTADEREDGPSVSQAPSERELAYAKAALEAECAELVETAEGGRNERLNKAALKLGRYVGAGWIDEAEVRNALLDACDENGLARDDGGRACRATIRSGLRAGKRQPARSLDLADDEFQDERGQQEIIDRFNEEFAVVQIKGNVRILREYADARGLPTFDLLTERDFKLLVANRGVVTTPNGRGKPKAEPASAFWLKSPQRREYRGLVFRPGEEPRSEPGSNGPPAFYNLWRGWGVEPNRKGSCRLFKEHLLENVCRGDAELCGWLMDWIAHIFVRPREKPGVAVVLQGKKGTGKSIVGKTLGVLLGPRHHFVLSQQEQLLGKFNAHLAGAMLIQAEEAFFAHDPRAWGSLKDLITRETRTVEPKGVDAYMVEAYDRLLITSNESAVVPAEPGERRYAVFEVGDQRAKDTAYFAVIEDELKAGGYERLLYELLQRGLHAFDCRRPIETEALAEQKLHNLPVVAEWMRDRLADGSLWTVRDNEERQDFRDERDHEQALGGDDERESRPTIGKDYVRCNYLEYLRTSPRRSHLSEAMFGKWLVENVGFSPTQRRCKRDRRDNDGRVIRKKGEREYCYRLPPLAEAREQFIKSYELPPTIFDESDDEPE